MALILTQRPGDAVYVTMDDEDGTTIVITVRGVKGSQVAIDFDAPRYVTIDREKVYRAKQREREMNHG